MDLQRLRAGAEAGQRGVQIVQRGLDRRHRSIRGGRRVDDARSGQSDRGAGQAEVFRTNGDGVGAVRIGQRRDVGRAILDEVGAVELRVRHDGADLVTQRGEVFVQGIAGRGVQRGVCRRQRLLFHFDQQVGDGFAGGQRHVRGGLGQIQRLVDGLVARHVCTHRLGDGEHAAIVLGRADRQAGVDALLNLLQILVGLVQVLEGDHGPRVGIDRRHFLAPVTFLRLM